MVYLKEFCLRRNEIGIANIDHIMTRIGLLNISNNIDTLF
jgi:hypothetical protein